MGIVIGRKGGKQMRPIDADALLAEYDRVHEGPPGRARKLIEQAPAIESEIIRCKDCKHWICHDRRCGYWNHGVKPLDWCSYAERRTDG